MLFDFIECSHQVQQFAFRVRVGKAQVDKTGIWRQARVAYMPPADLQVPRRSRENQDGADSVPGDATFYRHTVALVAAYKSAQHRSAALNYAQARGAKRKRRLRVLCRHPPVSVVTIRMPVSRQPEPQPVTLQLVPCRVKGSRTIKMDDAHRLSIVGAMSPEPCNWYVNKAGRTCDILQSQ